MIAAHTIDAQTARPNCRKSRSGSSPRGRSMRSARGDVDQAEEAAIIMVVSAPAFVADGGEARSLRMWSVRSKWPSADLACPSISSTNQS